MFDLRRYAADRGYFLVTLPPPRPVGLSRRRGGRLVADFPNDFALRRWLDKEPVVMERRL